MVALLKRGIQTQALFICMKVKWSVCAFEGGTGLARNKANFTLHETVDSAALILVQKLYSTMYVIKFKDWLVVLMTGMNQNGIQGEVQCNLGALMWYHRN